jgi:Flp pilus assembly pilin Flp
MSTKLAARAHLAALDRVARSRDLRADEAGQGTVEYVGLAMSIGVLLLAVGSFLSGKDHGIGTIVTNAIKAALQQASGAAK